MENLLLYDNIILNKLCLNRFISANYVKASFFSNNSRVSY